MAFDLVLLRLHDHLLLMMMIWLIVVLVICDDIFCRNQGGLMVWNPNWVKMGIGAIVTVMVMIGLTDTLGQGDICLRVIAAIVQALLGKGRWETITGGMVA